MKGGRVKGSIFIGIKIKNFLLAGKNILRVKKVKTTLHILHSPQKGKNILMSQKVKITLHSLHYSFIYLFNIHKNKKK